MFWPSNSPLKLWGSANIYSLTKNVTGCGFLCAIYKKKQRESHTNTHELCGCFSTEGPESVIKRLTKCQNRRNAETTFLVGGNLCLGTWSNNAGTSTCSWPFIHACSNRCSYLVMLTFALPQANIYTTIHWMIGAQRREQRSSRKSK